MSKKVNLKKKKDYKRNKRAYKKYRKNHYLETADYAIDCLMKEWY